MATFEELEKKYLELGNLLEDAKGNLKAVYDEYVNLKEETIKFCENSGPNCIKNAVMVGAFENAKTQIRVRNMHSVDELSDSLYGISKVERALRQNKELLELAEAILIAK